MGLLFGAGLAIASKKFAVEQDPRLADILSVLPGANCGACGKPGCSGYADAVIKGDKVNRCSVGGSTVAKKLAEIMGIKGEVDVIKTVARLRCSGTYSASPKVAEYVGPKDCRMAGLHGSGDKGCGYGCIGYGNCA
jgi:electron transport complex protein RnfB